MRPLNQVNRSLTVTRAVLLQILSSRSYVKLLDDKGAKKE